MAVADAIARLDTAVLEWVVGLRSDALTPVAELLSFWWFKGLVMLGIVLVADLVRRPRALPAGFLVALISIGVASSASSGLKALTDRARPPDAHPGIDALVPLPGDGSMPSGHAATAFAVAGAACLAHPRLRVPMLALAALVGLSRLYLGVHYPLDVLAGAALGLAAAVLVGWALRALAQRSGVLGRSLSGSAWDVPPVPLMAGPPGPPEPSRPWTGSTVSGAPGPARSSGSSGMSRVNSAGDFSRPLMGPQFPDGRPGNPG
jgi:undecaprenyl-diphosphatase